MPDEAPGPLSRFRVLDLTDSLGQPAGRYLADLGADVIKIEPPGGDPARALAPFAGGEPDPEKSIYFLQFNTNKRGIVLDLASAEGRQTFLRLVRTADVVLESFPPGYLLSLGLGYEALEAEQRGLVLTSISPFGQTGPYRDFRGNDLVCDAMGGMVYIEGEREGAPVAQPRYQALQMAGLHAAYGTLVALWHSLRTGEGQEVDISIQEVVAHEYLNLANYAAFQEIRRRVGKQATECPTNFFLCADGWVLVSVFLGTQWKALAEWSEDPVLMDPRFDDYFVRANSLELLDERIKAFTRRFSVEEFLTGAVQRRIPSGPVHDVGRFAEHPHTIVRRFLVEVDHPVVGLYRAPGAPATYSATPWSVRRPAPTLGQHTSEVRAELGVAMAGRAHPRGAPAPARGGTEAPERRAQGSTSSSGVRLPLEGLRVVDLTKGWAGPFGTRFLADFGADVIRVESLKFPDGRQSSPEPNPDNWLRSNAGYAEINRNKLSITLDLHTEGGRELLKRLVAVSDVIVENFHYATLPRWGLNYESLKRINPRLIMLSCPGYGSSGPARDYFAYGGCLTAFTGLAYLWGHPGAQQNEKAKQAYPDFITAANIAVAVMAALHHRQATGEGQHIELAQVDAAANMVGTAILEYTINGAHPLPWGNRDPNAAPQGVYPCRGEDRWVAISCATDDRWEALRHLMGDPAWTDDPRFATGAGRQAYHDEIDDGIATWTRQWTPQQAMLKCQRAGVPAGVVASGEDLYLDPQLRARGYVTEIEHPVPGRLEHPGVTVRLVRTPGRIHRPAPTTGQHNEEVFGHLLGLSAEARQAWAERGALV